MYLNKAVHDVSVVVQSTFPLHLIKEAFKASFFNNERKSLTNVIGRSVATSMRERTILQVLETRSELYIELPYKAKTSQNVPELLQLGYGL